MLQVQEYLLTHSLTDLAKEHGIYAGFGPTKTGYKFSLNYDQIESKDSDPLTHECRGLVLARQDGLVVNPDEPLGPTIALAVPFKRFFNYGQGSAAQIDWSTVKVMEKLDGTLGILYFDDFSSKWCVATRSAPEADYCIDGFGDYTFRRLFERCLCETLHLSEMASDADCFELFTNKLCGDYTYCFEITSPMNQVVVRYRENRLTLLAVIERTTGVESHILHNNLNGVRAVCVHPLGTLDEVLSFVASRSACDYEGVVLIDAAHNRVKVKNPGYLALGNIKSSAVASPRRLLELILSGKDDDAVGLVSQTVQEKLFAMKDGYLQLCQQVDRWYETEILRIRSNFDPGEERKQLAIACKAQGALIGPVMAIYQGKAKSFQGWVLNARNKDGSWPDSFLDNLLSSISC